MTIPDFSFAFQPIVNSRTKEISSYEALVRGPNNESAHVILNAINPDQKYYFDALLRQKAIAFAVELGIQTRLNLNLLPESLSATDNAISSTYESAKKHHFSPDNIVIEVTESEIIRDISGFKKILETYRSLGFTFSIDDFGAGYSGLNLLAEFLPDSIKIDMSLIRDIHKNGPRQAIIRGIIRTCEDLGIDLIAEGVECLDEYIWCYEEGIELFQGYYFSKPGFQSLPQVYFS
jgi:blue light- and temperature-responsive anti-repressor